MVKKKQSGFTLIETLIYIVLFTMIIGGGMVAAYQIIQATSGGTNHVVMEEEANFLLRKIDWALTGLGSSSSITSPSSTGTTLQVTKDINGTATQLTFCLVGNNLYLQRGATCNASSTQLNSSNVSVTPTSPNTFIFKRVTAANQPDGIMISFTLKTIQNGKNVTESFTTTKYLRQ